MVAVAAGAWMWRAHLLAWYWQGQLSRTADDEVIVVLGRVGQLGEVGIPVLVEALGARREAVASAAKRVLAQRQDRWENLPWSEVSPELLVLSEELAGRVKGFSPTAQREAERLAAWVLRWRPDQSTPERFRMVGACEQVLRSISRERLAAVDRRGSPREGAETDRGRAEPEDRPRTLDERGPGRRMRPLPGTKDFAALPAPRLPIARLAGDPLPAPRGDEPGKTTLRLAGAEPDNNELVVRPPRPRPPDGAEPRPNAPATLPRPGRSRPKPLAKSGEAKEDGAEDGSGGPPPAAPQIARTDTLALMRRLLRSGGDETARIRAELARRGFGEVHLELAKRLFDPDPEVRLALARRLPELKSVDAVPWLLWLCEDQSPEVRATAMALLATTGDPALIRRVERMAQADDDARVRRQAERIRQQQEALR